MLEILQDTIKQQIIQWTITYFDEHTTIKIEEHEKKDLKDKLQNFLSKYPNIITVSWDKIILNINEENFKALFKILLPYFGRWEALKNQPDFIKNNDWLILKHIRNSKWEKAKFYFFHYFGYLIMDIVNEINKTQPCNLTIWEYKENMLKWIHIKYIDETEFPEIMLNDSIKNLEKYF